MATPLLLLFDGHALIHRAFHALPELSTKGGRPTGAVYGFATMLLKALDEFKPTHCAVAFDSAAPTFRHVQFEEYKAHRPKAPDELVAQFGPVRELVRAFQLPILEKEGYEADDLIGALCRKARSAGIETVIVTGDTDMLQLVSPRVRALLPKPRRPFSDTQLYDEAAVRERYGLNPPQIADLKGLKGDPSDNIPGVPGIGEKTALKLITEFGSVEGIYERIEAVTPPKLRELLRANEPAARQSKALATIATDAPIAFDLDACRITGYDREKVIELFRSLEFHSLLGKLVPLGEQKQPVNIAPPARSSEYTIVNTSAALDRLIEELSSAETIAVDTETTSTDPRHAGLVGISLSIGEGSAWYIPVGHQGTAPQLSLAEVGARLGPILENPRIRKTAHNAKFDLTVLDRYGLPVSGLDFDTMIAAHLLGEKSLGLKPLAFGKLGIQMTPITDLIGTGNKQISMAAVEIARAAEYACADAEMTARLRPILEEEMKAQGVWQVFAEVEMPLVPILCRMEKAGVALDTTILERMSEELTGEIARLEGEIYDAVGHRFNINSSQQLGSILFEELKLPSSRKTKSGYSTDISVLEGLRTAHPAVGLIIEYRQLTKLKSTYVDALPALVDPDTGRLHTSFNQTVTATGRLSSSDPNLQNIPIRTELGRRIREAFIAPGDDSFLLSADYSQIELRVMAHLSQDPGLLNAFARDEDIHTATAATVFGTAPSNVTPDMRRIAKVVNFGVIYGMSDYGLEQATGLSRQEATAFIKSYFEKYAGVQAYIESTKRQAVEKGFVQTLLGRRRYIPEIKSSNYSIRQAAERMAINMPVQGTAAEIMKLAMIKVQAEMDRPALSSRMILQVHDELLFEVPTAEIESMKAIVGEIMPKAMELSVPLKIAVKTGRNWGEIE